MLTLNDLHKHYGTTVAVDGISLHVRPGEVFGLLGPNGAGKSTTIAMISGVLRPDSGSVRIGAPGGATLDPADAEARRLIGVAPQALALYDELSAEENLLFFGRMYGLGGPALRDRADEMLRFVGLADRRRDRAGKYSGGMKRRLNLAVAMMHAPPLLLLDEPTAGVDPQSRNAIFEMIERLRDGGVTVLYTTHYMEEAERLCNRVAIIDGGRVLAIDGLDALIGAHGGVSVVTVQRRGGGEERLETANPAADLPGLLAAGDVLGLRVDRPSLETVFLGLTGRSLRD